MPTGWRNRKRESSPTNERPTKRQRANDTPRQNLAAEETHEKEARDKSKVHILRAKELSKDQHSTRNAKNASHRSKYTRQGHATATWNPEDPAISLSKYPPRVNRSAVPPTRLAFDRIPPTGTQSDPPDKIDAGSTSSVEVPVSHLPKRGRPKTVPEEDSPSKAQTLALGPNSKGEYIL
jgi:hypothetical protein